MTYIPDHLDKLRNTELQRWANRVEIAAHSMPDCRKTIHFIPADNVKQSILRLVNEFRAELELIGVQIETEMKEVRE